MYCWSLRSSLAARTLSVNSDPHCLDVKNSRSKVHGYCQFVHTKQLIKHWNEPYWTSAKMFFQTKRTQAAEIDLDLETCPSKGPNTYSVLVCRKSIQWFPRYLPKTPFFVPGDLDLDVDIQTRPSEGPNMSENWGGNQLTPAQVKMAVKTEVMVSLITIYNQEIPFLKQIWQFSGKST